MGTLLALTNDCLTAGRFVLLLYGKQINEVNLRSWPGAVIGMGYSIAAIGNTECSIPVVQPRKAEYDVHRLLWGGGRHSFTWSNGL